MFLLVRALVLLIPDYFKNYLTHNYQILYKWRTHYFIEFQNFILTIPGVIVCRINSKFDINILDGSIDYKIFSRKFQDLFKNFVIFGIVFINYKLNIAWWGTEQNTLTPSSL